MVTETVSIDVPDAPTAQAVAAALAATPSFVAATTGAAGVSPTSAAVAASLAATPSFVAAVAALLAPPVVVTPPVITPPTGAPVLKVVLAQNGATPALPQDYSYSATDVHAYTATGGDDNPDCIRVNITGAWGGYQPSDNNGVVQNFSACTKVVVSLMPTLPNQKWSIQFLKGGDLPILAANGQGAGIHFPRAGIDPVPTVGKWDRYVFDIVATGIMEDYTTGTAVDVRPIIFKGAVEDQTGLAANTWYIDNWGGM